jgi:HK97 family phage major capsid protein
LDIDKLPESEQPSEDIKSLLGRATEISQALQGDREDRAELKANLASIKDQINDLQRVENDRAKQAENAQILADLEALKESTRRPSKAGAVNRNQPYEDSPTNFFSTLAVARSAHFAGSIEAQQKAQLDLGAMGSYWGDVPSESKATVGGSNAAGGYLVPSPVIREINLQATPGRAVVDLLTVVEGVVGTGVAVPFEDANSVYSRAIIAGAGTLKENSNFITNSYTATLYTLARIYDVGNQLLRNSQGAAEQLVRSALGRAFAQGEDYYAIQGSGSSEPYGLLTALGTSGTYFTTFSSPSQSTIAGNWATAVAAMAGAVANRGAQPDAAVLNSGDYWTLIASGADAAGFYVDPVGGSYNFNGAAAGVSGAGPWGLALRHTPNMPSDSAVVGEFRSALFFRGQSYRVDVSSEAGTRWDYNLTGFRGEEEIGFDARPSVYTGHFQRVSNIKP